MLSPDDAAAVLRRAAELDTPALEEHDALDESVVREAAREVGLSEAAVDQAVTEWRAGLLAPLPALPPDRRAGLPGLVAVEGPVALAPQVARERLEAWLCGQWFERRRSRGAETEWAPRGGVLAGVRRAADLDRRLRLGGVGRLRVCVTPGTPAPGMPAQAARVRLVADLGETRRDLLGGLVVAPAVVVGGGVGLGLGLTGDLVVDALAAVPAALGAGGLGWLGAAKALQTRRLRLQEELERVLDELTLVEPRRGLPDRAAAWALQRLPQLRPPR